MAKADQDHTRPELTIEEPAHEHVFAMENDVILSRNYAHALSLIGETMEEVEGMVTCQLARDILANVEEIEEKRCKLFKLLHPNRDHFERVGWPGDRLNKGDDGLPLQDEPNVTLSPRSN